jgi:ADP-ribose pyrophosphatase YjhB (NUDIX family)
MSMTVPSAGFCRHCGDSLEERFLKRERRWRAVCRGCGSVAYHNPRVLVTTVVACGEEVLLCRRAEAPAIGGWTLPGGFLECAEGLEDGAARETLEETGVRLDPRQLQLYSVSTLLHTSEVYVGFLAELAERPDLICGLECSQVKFLSERDVPWAELAYPDIANYLKTYFRERRNGERAIHVSCLDIATVQGSLYSISRVQRGSR